MFVKFALVGVGAVVGVALAVAGVGLLLPREHVARRVVALHRGPDEVWTVLADVERYPEWRPDVRRVERLPDVDGRPRWREVGAHDAIAFELVEATAPTRRVIRIADPDLPFGGTWTYELAPSPAGCTLAITERGEVKNPVFRFLSRFVLGHTATIDAFLRDLGRKLGEEAEPG